MIETNTATQVLNRHTFLVEQRRAHHDEWFQIARLTGSLENFDYPNPDVETDEDTSRRRYDDTIMVSRKAFVALLMSYGMNSMAKWFSFTLKDGSRPSPLVSQTLARWHREVNAALIKGGLYNEMEPTAESCGDFGNGVLTFLPGDHVKPGFNGYRISNVPLSRIYYGVNGNGAVDISSEEIKQTAYVALSMFNKPSDYVPEKIKKAYASSSNTRFRLIRQIFPIEPGNPDTRYQEIYLFDGEKIPSRINNRKYFPHFVARMGVSSGSIYGRGCGASCLASTRVANQLMKRGTQAADLAGLQTWLADQHVRINTDIIRPGKVIRATNIDRIKAMDHKNDMSFWQVVYSECRSNIRSSYYADMLALGANRPEDMKAHVADEIGRRQMMMLSPVFNRMDGEFFKAVLERALNIYIESQPPEIKRSWPAELKDGANIESCSPIAKAQQETELQAWREFVTDAAGLMTVNPEIADWFKNDEALFSLASKHGIDLDMLTKAIDVRKIRFARAAQAQAQQQQIAAVQQSAVVKDVAQARKYNAEASQQS